ncbi:MAG: HAMP domain-containing histidine kinase [Flavobacteriales bacterium]|nr:HAMP domain-containing histidine kinase [Flavobacteriales bacterium]
MKQKRFYTLIALMTISLIGIIWVQVYWIHNALLVKRVQFNQLVNEALNHAITDMEDEESFHFIHKQLSDETAEVVVTTDSAGRQVKTIKQWTSKVTSDDEKTGENSYEYNITSDDNGKGVEMKISVNGNTQTIDLSNKLKNIETLLHEDSVLAGNEENIVITNRLGKMMIKMVNEFKDIDEPVEHLLKHADLDAVITKNLSDYGIEAPFSYAVYNNGELLSAFSDQDFSDEDAIKVSLFKHHLFGDSAQLAISFGSNKHRLILRSMGFMLVSSILFTLIIIITFAFTIHYMLKQKKISEIKNDFINNMTHEFKTPISTISLAIDSITHPQIIDNKEKINYYADIIRKENKRMNKQVESVLNTSLAEKNELQLEKASFEVDDFLNRIHNRMKLQLDDAHVSYQVINRLSKSTITADETHLENVVCNLLDNAIKYRRDESKITCLIEEQDGTLVFSVTDNGIGMSKETQKKIFDKFYRVQSGNIHSIKGFGIGLSYVKAIVAAHGGTISVTSKLNEGSTVTIKIPTRA